MTDGTGGAGAAAQGTAAPGCARRRAVTAVAALGVVVAGGCAAPAAREPGAAARASRGPGVPGVGVSGTAAASPGVEPGRAGTGAGAVEDGVHAASGAGKGPARGTGPSDAEGRADAHGGAGGAGGPGAPAASGDPDPPPGLPSSAPLEVRLGAACVRPGDTQSVEIETLPEAYVAYDNLYPDNRDGSVHGGVDGQARSDAEGRFRATWVVAPGTPLGRVRIDVGVSAPGGSAITMRYYRLAASC